MRPSRRRQVCKTFRPPVSSKPAFRLLVLVLFATTGCTHKQSVSEARTLLTCDWNLHIGSDCANYDVASDRLILHPDGTFEQHTVSKRGFRYDTLAEKWEYSPANHVLLDSRKDFFNVFIRVYSRLGFPICVFLRKSTANYSSCLPLVSGRNAAMIMAIRNAAAQNENAHARSFDCASLPIV